MQKPLLFKILNFKTFLIISLLISSLGNAQITPIMQVDVLGSDNPPIASNDTISISAGSAVTFRITNALTWSCGTVRVQNITITNTITNATSTDFSLTPTNPTNVKPAACNGTTHLDFTVTALGTECITYYTKVTIETNLGPFTFTFEVVKTPIISVAGGTPSTTIINGDTTPTYTDGTYFGIQEDGAAPVTRVFLIINTGSCTLDISSIISTNPVFPIAVAPALSIAPGAYTYFVVAYAANALAPTTSTITIGNTDTTFVFDVGADLFNFEIPGPGGVTADFRLWLKATRGVKLDTIFPQQVNTWKDLGTNGKSAIQPDTLKQPTYLDDVASNINFNPVIKFENNGNDIEQYLYNNSNGFYSQDIFIVTVPDSPISESSPRSTIFAGISKKDSIDVDNEFNGDITGIGFGNYTSKFTNESLSYSQGTEVLYNGEAEISTTYDNDKPGIINIRNNDTTIVSTVLSQEILYNSHLLTTSSNDDITYVNTGYIDNQGNILGTPYWIGRNYDLQGSLNGSVAEIFTFAKRVTDVDRPKIETYLAIKYGLTLGETIAEKDYIDSEGTILWDVSANTGYNYNVAGIGKDQSSDLDQKQSKSVNEVNEVTIGLGVIAATNKANTNGFSDDHDYLIWGSNNKDFSFISDTAKVEITSGISTSFNRIERIWKIVETGGDVGDVFVGIPEREMPLSALLTDEEEYVLIVSDSADFANADIVDVVPMKLAKTIYGTYALDKEGEKSYQTWYDFDGTKFFTFGKALRLTDEKRLVNITDEKRVENIAAGDYFVGEYGLNLNTVEFSISAWVRNIYEPNAPLRTIMAKGSKLDLRLNTDSKVEVIVGDPEIPVFISKMALTDSKWHNITFVYKSGTVYLYVDGILDKTLPNIAPPTPNFNRFSLGALYLGKNESDIIQPFLGEIDEVRVWDLGLTEGQVRYLMNQEFEKVTGDFVNGKVIPQGILNNEVITIPWSKLSAYYDFNTFCGSTVPGLTNYRNFLRIRYLQKGKSIAKTQTAPLPYVSAADGVWDVPATWAHSDVQNLPNSKGLDVVGEYLGTDINWNIVETTHNISSGDNNIEVLALKNISGEITIDGTFDLASGTGTGHGLRVSHYLEIDGVIDLEGESQLYQDEDSTLDEDSGGHLERHQQGTANSFNYNYWSSSVGPIRGNSATRGTGVASINADHAINSILNDGTNLTNQGEIDFNTPYTWADNSYDGAKRISSYWLYTFNGASDNYWAWKSIDENTQIKAGEGYTMKGTSGAVAVTTNQNYVFKGKPYNGDLLLPIALGNDRLIGNPYPSALNADAFILDNLSYDNGGNNENGNIFNGTLYFWDHFGQANSHYLAAYVGGYATYNLMGGVEAISNDTRINNNNAYGVKKPEQYIAVGQAFFVIAVGQAVNDTLTGAVDGGDIVFKNSQRVFVGEGATGTNVGSVFFKGNGKVKEKEPGDKRTKIRLKFSSPTGYHRQLLLGIDENTSNHFDMGYDAPIADVNKEDMFWTFDGAKFVIQAVNNFNTDQELPLGVKIAKTGLVTIKIDELENFDEDISLHIKDKLTGEIHNISKKSFEIELGAGTYLDRFSLIFKMQKLVAEDVKTEVLIPAATQPIIEGVHVFMNNTIKELQIKNNSDEEILSVELYNYLGQPINNWNTNLNRRIISLPVNTATGVYIVQINTKTGKTVSKISVE